MKTKTTGEQMDILYKKKGKEELKLGQYARQEIPLTELMEYLHNDTTEWISVDDLCKWLQETFGNADNINLILNEIGRCRRR
jgi:hypothetical protein